MYIYATQKICSTVIKVTEVPRCSCSVTSLQKSSDLVKHEDVE